MNEQHEVTHHSETGLDIKDSGKREVFETGANRDLAEGKGRFDLLPWHALEDLAKLFEAGCLKYGDRNWEKGIPAHRFADSAARHLAKFIRGDKDEDHLIAAAWNLLCLRDTEKRVKDGRLPWDLLDLPRYDSDKVDAQIKEALPIADRLAQLLQDAKEQAPQPSTSVLGEHIAKHIPSA